MARVVERYSFHGFHNDVFGNAILLPTSVTEQMNARGANDMLQLGGTDNACESLAGYGLVAEIRCRWFWRRSVIRGRPGAECPHLLRAKIDAIFAPLVDAKSPGMAVLVRAERQDVFERGYGVRDLATGGAKIDAQTNFRLASCTQAIHRDGDHAAGARWQAELRRQTYRHFPGVSCVRAGHHDSQFAESHRGLQDYETLMEKSDAAESATLG